MAFFEKWYFYNSWPLMLKLSQRKVNFWPIETLVLSSPLHYILYNSATKLTRSSSSQSVLVAHDARFAPNTHVCVAIATFTMAWESKTLVEQDDTTVRTVTEKAELNHFRGRKDLVSRKTITKMQKKSSIPVLRNLANSFPTLATLRHRFFYGGPHV